MKIFHIGGNFERLEQSIWTKPILWVSKKTIVISKNSTKCGFAKNRSNKPFVFAGNFDIEK